MMYGMTSMQFEHFLDQLLNFGRLSALFQVPSFTLGIAAYVLTALALYTLAKRRGIDNAWFSWVPVLKLWIIGSLSDQYRYVVKGQVKSKRKVLVVLSIISMVLTVAIVIVSGMAVAQVAASVFTHVSEDVLLGRIVGLILTVCGLALPLAGVGLASMVIQYMAVYDIYTSCDPENSVLFLVLSIVFSITQPFFLFFSRNKDKGMPPRKPEPQQPPQTQYTYQADPDQPWEE